ncbi:tRNA dihydrouridine synthase DusB [Candidatus Woesearchaeota archaeon]|jgi:tRNA-dihydrouridine synthase B|nr:tRNA dihydrouridine synthase DusB [Candidatus Woesearchaeota archaeon]MBT6520071.1 tRNA dihydrouridine synthase DusB [Candidatus Woesearchaeota archaeon]MBT7366676.1 tRNA dihydrouridine synthase DusB [Candidatus Woesearchaeota archaeon]
MNNMRKIPKFKSPALLAPLAGYTDAAFRVLCRHYGCGLAVTEMISANALSRENKATIKLIDVDHEDSPRCVQLFGQNTENLVKAAKYCMDSFDIEMIDLNFGCPASKIIRQGAGSALLERPAKVKEIVESVVGCVSVPVSCKIRSGISRQKINAVKIGQVCEEAGASLLTVHARTQKQGYTGKADWNVIKDVVNAVDIPVSGNGDVCTVKDFERMVSETGCSYVMIGRGAMGNPFLFKQINDYLKNGKYESITVEDRFKMFNEYYDLALEFGLGLKSVKLHAQTFTKGITGATKFRHLLTSAKSFEEIKEIMSLEK